MLSFWFPGDDTEHPTETIQKVPVIIRRFLELNLMGWHLHSLPSYSVRAPSMFSSTLWELPCPDGRLADAAALSVGVCSQPSYTSVVEMRTNIRKSFLLQRKPDSCKSSVLFCLKNKSKTNQSFSLSNSWNEPSTQLVSASCRLSWQFLAIIVSVFWKQVIAALQVKWTLIRLGPLCIRVKKHLVSELREPEGVEERWCCVWICREKPLFHLIWEGWLNGDFLS